MQLKLSFHLSGTLLRGLCIISMLTRKDRSKRKLEGAPKPVKKNAESKGKKKETHRALRKHQGENNIFSYY